MLKKKTKPVATTETTMQLQRITMVVPTAEFIYAPSKLQPVKKISYTEFLAKFADNARPVKVSFAKDGKSDPQIITAYGSGLDCWYIVV